MSRRRETGCELRGASSGPVSYRRFFVIQANSTGTAIPWESAKARFFHTCMVLDGGRKWSAPTTTFGRPHQRTVNGGRRHFPRPRYCATQKYSIIYNRIVMATVRAEFGPAEFGPARSPILPFSRYRMITDCREPAAGAACMHVARRPENGMNASHLSLYRGLSTLI